MQNANMIHIRINDKHAVPFRSAINLHIILKTHFSISNILEYKKMENHLGYSWRNIKNLCEF